MMAKQSLKQVIYQVIAELRLLAAAGLKFAATHHDQERYTRVRQAAAQLAATIEEIPETKILEQMTGDLFEQRVSPILTVDAAVMCNGRILLIQRHDDKLWAMPGGMVEVNQTLAKATLRELYEETGITGTIRQLLGVYDSHLWESQSKHHMQHFVFLVDRGDQQPHPTREALDVGFFAEEALPPLSRGHHRRVPFVFQQLYNENLIPYIDDIDIAHNQ